MVAAVISRNYERIHDKPWHQGQLTKNVWILQPAYFALVMATGIVAIAAYLDGLPLTAKLLSLG